MLAAGNELATAASQALSVDMNFENISEYVSTHPFPPPPFEPRSYLVSQNRCMLTYLPVNRAEAKKVLHSQSHSDDSEKQYLLEYYSLVREGKTNYICTTAFVNVTGSHPMEPTDFFKVYAEEFLPEHPKKRQKMDGK